MVHYECFQVFMYVTKATMSESEALDQLWLLSSWRSPWRKATELHLTPSNPSSHVQEADQFMGGFRLSALPLELVAEIWRLSSDASLWRVISVLHLASKVDQSPLSVVPLARIASWERHGQFVHQGEDSSGSGYVKLVIDRFGIQKIERIEKLPSFNANKNRDLAYVIEEESDLKELQIQAKVSASNLFVGGLFLFYLHG